MVCPAAGIPTSTKKKKPFTSRTLTGKAVTIVATDMYSQYHQYNNHHRGETVAASQPGMQWNGRDWVRSTDYVHTRSHSTHSTSTEHQSAADLVTTYTQYYNQWKAKEEAEGRKARALNGDAKREAERLAVWAKYYAELSSRAAHHYHNSPLAPPPQLPPAPPPISSSEYTVSQSSTSRDNQPFSNQSPQNHQSPEGMKRYVHRCLSSCSGKEQEDYMQKEIEKVIARAVQEGNMHSTNWDQKALIPLPGSASHTNIKQERTNRNGRTQGSWGVDYNGSSYDGNDESYYGPKNINTNKPKGEAASAKKVKTYSPKGEAAAAKKVNTYSPKGEASPDKYSYYGKKNNAGSSDVDYSYYGKPPTAESKSGLSGDFVSVPYVATKPNKLERKTAKSTGKRKPEDGFEKSQAALAKRANRFKGAGGIKSASTMDRKVGNDYAKYMGMGVIGGSKKLKETDFEKMTVKGTCEKLEKEYLRLTAPPRADLVRPLRVLKRHVENLKSEWKGKRVHDYEWFCSQFKSVRQDLTVQRIANGFAIEVYESHARIALEEGDLNEYNQCQTQLKELYAENQFDDDAMKNKNEFMAYRLIYYVFLTGNKKYEEGSSDLSKIMLSLSADLRKDVSIAHALQVRAAVAEFDYHRFFRLYDSCPTRGASFLMNFLVPNVRQVALNRICKAYRPSIEVKFVLSELGFSTKKSDDGMDWLKSCGCVLSSDEERLLTKESVIRESDQKVQNSLI